MGDNAEKWESGVDSPRCELRVPTLPAEGVLEACGVVDRKRETVG